MRFFFFLVKIMLIKNFLFTEKILGNKVLAVEKGLGNKILMSSTSSI